MKIRTTELTDIALDWAVAKCKNAEGRLADGWLVPAVFLKNHDEHDFNYSTDWSQGGPIIEREGIDLHQFTRPDAQAWTYTKGDENRPDYEIIARHTRWGPSRSTLIPNKPNPHQGKWMARMAADYHPFGWKKEDSLSDTPLQAAMRCFCASKLGPEIDIPEELL